MIAKSQNFKEKTLILMRHLIAQPKTIVKI
jgi:hypothetical protein